MRFLRDLLTTTSFRMGIELKKFEFSAKKFAICLVIGVTIALTIIIVYLGEHISLKSTTLSYSPLSDGLHYAIVIDAGSSGSRAYLYAWPSHSGNPHELLKIGPITGLDGEPLVEKVTPGLSSLSDDPKRALEYISPLLKFAEKHIPRDRHKETPLYILATAGMRLIDKDKQTEILDNLKKGISKKFPFLFPENNLEIISGKQEGIYQWLAINYVLEKFESHSNGEGLIAVESWKKNGKVGDNLVFRSSTVGAIDMGGASMQIAMEITSELQMAGLTEKEKNQVAEINLGCKEHDTEHTYRVFVTTFLGYGANEALARSRRELFLSQSEKSISEMRGHVEELRLEDSCLPAGMIENSTVTLNSANLEINEDFKKLLKFPRQPLFLVGTGNWDACYNSLKEFTRTREKYVKCYENCPGAGIRVPQIPFDKADFYGFSEFWYSMEDVLNLGGQYFFDKYRKASREFCSTKWSTTWRKYLDGQYPQADVERMRTQCFKSAWLTVALHEGFQFPESYSHLSAAPNSVNGQVIHWTIGALLYRTRFFPLRAIDSRGHESIHHGIYHQPWQLAYLYSYYIVLFCLALVLAAIFLYIRRLKRYVKPSTLRKVPSTVAFWLSSANMDHAKLLDEVSLNNYDENKLTSLYIHA